MTLILRCHANSVLRVRALRRTAFEPRGRAERKAGFESKDDSEVIYLMAKKFA